MSLSCKLLSICCRSRWRCQENVWIQCDIARWWLFCSWTFHKGCKLSRDRPAWCERRNLLCMRILDSCTGLMLMAPLEEHIRFTIDQKMSWTSIGIQFYFNILDRLVNRPFFVVKLGFVLWKPISSFGLLSTDVAVPEKMSRKVDRFEVVLHVHLPTVAEPTTWALISSLGSNHIL